MFLNAFKVSHSKRINSMSRSQEVSSVRDFARHREGFSYVEHSTQDKSALISCKTGSACKKPFSLLTVPSLIHAHPLYKEIVIAEFREVL